MATVSDHRSRTSVSLPEKVAFLQRADTYPDASGGVEAIETHMAWVFLTDRHAYKLKKPVDLEKLDFTTAARRHWACVEEVRLNRRLAGDVYQGVVPLRTGPRGGLRFGDGGEVVDWLVQMQRLPSERMLDALIEAGAWPSEDVRRGVQAAVRRLARFYEAAPPVSFAPAEYVQRFYEEIRTTAHALVASPHPLSLERVRDVFASQTAYLRRTPDALRARARERRIVEGHGDLRPEHICLTDEPVIFDCLEFDRSLRLLDPADELSFLAMECARLGAPEVGTLALATYTDATGDAPPEALMHFYQSCRALQRARIAVRHTRRPATFDEVVWTGRANAYLERAAHHAARLEG